MAPGIRALRAAGVQVRGCAQRSKVELRWAPQYLESKSSLNPPRLPCQALPLIWHRLTCAPCSVPPARPPPRRAVTQVAVLTNGSEAIARGVLSRAGIEGLVDPVLDIGMAQAWKPARESYHFALGQLGLAAGEVRGAQGGWSCGKPSRWSGPFSWLLVGMLGAAVRVVTIIEKLCKCVVPKHPACTLLHRPRPQVMMVAAHPWDVHGAMQAGLLGAYVQRSPHEPYPAWLPLQPHTVAADFEALAAQLGTGGRSA